MIPAKENMPIAGYSTSSVLHYDRGAIHANPFRIKEWDFYQISDHEKCLQLTFGHASYAGQVGVMPGATGLRSLSTTRTSMPSIARPDQRPIPCRHSAGRTPTCGTLSVEP